MSNADSELETFFRTCNKIFSFNEFVAIAKKVDKSITSEKCKAILMNSPYVFELVNSNFVTLAGVFTNRLFSIRPHSQEVKDSILIAGHRCMPFVDTFIHPSKLIFMYNGKELPKKVQAFSATLAMDIFSLYGRGLSIEIICKDAANAGKTISDLVNNGEFVDKFVRLTCLDITPIIKAEGFNYGDRLNCQVIDWDKGVIDVCVVHTSSKSLMIEKDDIERQKWFGVLEEKLLDSFKILGSCSSIQDQLIMVFMQNLVDLCTKNCGSVEELLDISKRVGIEDFGFETRLWKKGEDVLPNLEWNADSIPKDVADAISKGIISDVIVKQFITNIIYCVEQDNIERRSSNSRSGKRPAKLPFDKAAKKYIQQVADLLSTSNNTDILKDSDDLYSRIKDRLDTLRQDYDTFGDYDIAPLRKIACQIYDGLYTTIHEISNLKIDLKKISPQFAILLIQLFEHAAYFLETVNSDPQSIKDNIEDYSASLNGMNVSYELLLENVENAIKDAKQDNLTVS